LILGIEVKVIIIIIIIIIILIIIIIIIIIIIVSVIRNRKDIVIFDDENGCQLSNAHLLCQLNPIVIIHLYKMYKHTFTVLSIWEKLKQTEMKKKNCLENKTIQFCGATDSLKTAVKHHL
jgi:hypothetical protein